MDEPTPSEIVHAAIDDLLLVVAKAADDLRTFHTVVSHARIAPLPPFPRASVAVTSSIIKNLQKVEEELREVVIALGLSESARPPFTRPGEPTLAEPGQRPGTLPGT